MNSEQKQNKMPGRKEEEARKRKRLAKDCYKLDSWLKPKPEQAKSGPEVAKPGAELSELTEVSQVTVSLGSVDTGMETTSAISTVASASSSASASNSTVTDIGKFELSIFLNQFCEAWSYM